MSSPEVQEIVASMHDHAVMDPDGSLLDKTGLPEEELAEISQVMAALRTWKTEEARQSKASSEYMALSERDMHALRFIMAGARAGKLVTPAMLADYLGITSAAVTKLLDRLQAGDHLHRSPHPADRRAIVLTVTPHTRESARSQVGASHARRFAAAARLAPDERKAVIRFLTDLSEPPPPFERTSPREDRSTS